MTTRGTSETNDVQSQYLESPSRDLNSHTLPDNSVDVEAVRLKVSRVGNEERTGAELNGANISSAILTYAS